MSENPVRDAIQDAIRDHEVILFMKGTPERPMCGFSARTAAALEALGAEYAAVDILPDPRIRQELSAISNWPTIPQLFVKGELVGGCDIVTEMYESGELATRAGRRAAHRRARGERRRAGRAAADRQPALEVAAREGAQRERSRSGRGRPRPTATAAARSPRPLRRGRGRSPGA